MKMFLSGFAVTLLAIAGCDRAPRGTAQTDDRERAADQRAEDDRYQSELRDLERRAAERDAAARAAETDLDRKKIADERAALEREKAQLVAERRVAEEARSAADGATVQSAAAARQQDTREESTLDLFYEALDPHGEWVEVESYGYCWRPSAARDQRWRPYTDGTWAWTDYGWTWVSNEPFGWAAYHYGRWTRVRRLGWVWVPGSEWAPAWVAWRHGDLHVGWAPLPPEAHSGAGFTAAVDSYYDIGPSHYTFVAVETFGEPTYIGRIVQPEENITIINKTVNVTNITYRSVENKTVVHNAGPELDAISRKSRRPVQRMKVERVAAVDTAPKSERRGDVLRLPAPTLKSTVKAAPAKKLKERVKADELDRGWTEAPGEQGNAIRAQQKREAREAEETQRSGKRQRTPQVVEERRADPGASAPAKTATPAEATSQPAPAPPAVPAPNAAPVENAPEQPARENRERARQRSDSAEGKVPGEKRPNAERRRNQAESAPATKPNNSAPAPAPAPAAPLSTPPVSPTTVPPNAPNATPVPLATPAPDQKNARGRRARNAQREETKAEKREERKEGKEQ